MDNALYTSLSGQLALRRKLDIVANNVANINTPGFKRENAHFEEVFAKLEADGKGVAFVQDRASTLDYAQGAMTQTGGDLDVALSGEGMFSVRGAGGETLYTRDGRFAKDAENRLITVATGAPALDTDGGEITIPPEAGRVTIGRDGTISDPAIGQIARLGIFKIPPLETERVADGLYAYEGRPEPDTETGAIQGFIENSNVNPVRELTELIAVQRAYEASKSMLDREDERIKRAVSTLAQVR